MRVSPRKPCTPSPRQLSQFQPLAVQRTLRQHKTWLEVRGKESANAQNSKPAQFLCARPAGHTIETVPNETASGSAPPSEPGRPRKARSASVRGGRVLEPLLRS